MGDAGSATAGRFGSTGGPRFDPDSALRVLAASYAWAIWLARELERARAEGRALDDRALRRWSPRAAR